MYLEFLVLIISFFIFIYNLYYVSREDLLLIRRDIYSDKIFNLAIIAGLTSLFSARLFYVISYPDAVFQSILGFVAFTYYPGLSLVGAIAGGAGFVFLYARHKKYPSARLLDLFTVSLLGALPIGFLLDFIISLGKTDSVFNTLFVALSIVSLVFIKGVYRLSQKGEIKDGSFSLIFLIVFTLINFLAKLLLNMEDFSFLKAENLLSFFIIFFSIFALLNQEIINKLLSKK